MFELRVERGQLLPAMLPAPRPGGGFLYELWCHPDDEAEMLNGGIRTVNGQPKVSAMVVDRLKHVVQIRVETAC